LVPGGDINLGPPSSSPQELVNVNGTLFLSADDGIFGRELWMKQPGRAPEKVKDIRPGPDGSEPLHLTEVGPASRFETRHKLHSLYFSADDGLHGRELWRTIVAPNGRIFDTRLVEDINPGIDGSDPGELTAFTRSRTFDPSKDDASETNTLFFAATDNLAGRELWRSNGNAQNTRIVRDINPGLADSAPSYLTVAKTRVRGNVLYFAADNFVFGRELWRTIPNVQDAFLVKDIRPGPDGSNPFRLTKVSISAKRADIVFFGADDGFVGAELWRSNGTRLGTFLVEDIKPGGPDTDSLEESPTTLMAEFRHRLYFAADDGRFGRELWRSLGARDSAELFKDINPGPNSSNPTAQDHPLPKLRNLIVRGPNRQDLLLFFGADDGFFGGEPWRTDGRKRLDGRTPGTFLLKDIHVGRESSLIQNELVGIVFPDIGFVFPNTRSRPGRTLYFAADDGIFGRELWRSDRIANSLVFNTQRDTDINPGAPPSDPASFEISGSSRFSTGRVFFAADRALFGRELWQAV